MIVALLLSGCFSGGGPYIDPCEWGEPVQLAIDEASPFGESAQDLIDEYGDGDEIAVTWTGRHSQTPPSDIITVSYGEVGPEIWYQDATATNPDNKGMCDDADTLWFERAATVETADGAVSGVGVAGFAWNGETLEVDVSSEAVTLSEARWIEVEKALGTSLPSPDFAFVYLYRDYVGIGVDGDGYSVNVWKCQESKKGDCVTW